MEILASIIVGIVWVISLIGCCVTITIFFINLGEGDSDWEKKFWWKVSKKYGIMFLLFAPIFALSNYFYYLIFISS